MAIVDSPLCCVLRAGSRMVKNKAVYVALGVPRVLGLCTADLRSIYGAATGDLAIRNFEKRGRNIRQWFAARNQFGIIFAKRFNA